MTVVLVIAAIVVGIAVALNGFAPDALGQEHNRMSLVYYLCWLVLAGGALFSVFRENWGEAFRNAAIWLVALLVLVAGYSVRHDLKSLGSGTLAALVPGMAIETLDRAVDIRRARDGHFYAWGKAEGRDVKFVVDTGASFVALTAADARQIGIETQELDFTMQVATANGRTHAAPLRIGSLEIGGIEFANVEAAVMRPGQLGTSLLGMSFLSRLQSYSFEGDRLVMRR